MLVFKGRERNQELVIEASGVSGAVLVRDPSDRDLLQPPRIHPVDRVVPERAVRVPELPRVPPDPERVPADPPPRPGVQVAQSEEAPPRLAVPPPALEAPRVPRSVVASQVAACCRSCLGRDPCPRGPPRPFLPASGALACPFAHALKAGPGLPVRCELACAVPASLRASPRGRGSAGPRAACAGPSPARPPASSAPLPGPALSPSRLAGLRAPGKPSPRLASVLSRASCPRSAGARSRATRTAPRARR